MGQVLKMFSIGALVFMLLMPIGDLAFASEWQVVESTDEPTHEASKAAALEKRFETPSAGMMRLYRDETGGILLHEKTKLAALDDGSIQLLQGSVEVSTFEGGVVVLQAEKNRTVRLSGNRAFVTKTQAGLRFCLSKDTMLVEKITTLFNGASRSACFRKENDQWQRLEPEESALLVAKVVSPLPKALQRSCLYEAVSGVSLHADKEKADHGKEEMGDGGEEKAEVDASSSSVCLDSSGGGEGAGDIGDGGGGNEIEHEMAKVRVIIEVK